MKMTEIFSWVGFFGISFGTTNDWKGWCLWLGIWALYVSLNLKIKEDK